MLTAPIIRFKELPHKDFGACEHCRERPATVYAISSLEKCDMGAFVCMRCVPVGATEIQRSHDMYAI